MDIHFDWQACDSRSTICVSPERWVNFDLRVLKKIDIRNSWFSCFKCNPSLAHPFLSHLSKHQRQSAFRIKFCGPCLLVVKNVISPPLLSISEHHVNNGNNFRGPCLSVVKNVISPDHTPCWAEASMCNMSTTADQPHHAKNDNPSKGGVSAACLKQPWNNLMTWDKPTINCATCWDIFYKSPVAQISYETNCLGWPLLYVEDPFGGDPPIAQVLRQDDCGMYPTWKNPSYSPILHRILRGLIHQG